MYLKIDGGILVLDNDYGDFKHYPVAPLQWDQPDGQSRSKASLLEPIRIELHSYDFVKAVPMDEETEDTCEELENP